MQKLMLIIGITISLFTMSAYAGQTRAEVYKWNHESIMNGRERTPVRLPTIDIIYDSASQSIEIISSMDCDATVVIYDMNGNLIESSTSLDDILYVSGVDNSVFYIRIESDNWYATATIMA